MLSRSMWSVARRAGERCRASRGPYVPDGICLAMERAVGCVGGPHLHRVRVCAGGEARHTIPLVRGCFVYMLGAHACWEQKCAEHASRSRPGGVATSICETGCELASCILSQRPRPFGHS